ncbi:CvpA family protein [Pedobacter faecalis]|uniref:CvpA family protein n=1 Tax=Pedobacter faecalis TaxID=3041495 RepID=UPI00254FE80F|nr:CvpA family protein [Pedobacter sp. ELA7]
MNWLDFILIIILLLSILSAVQRGFILSAAELVCWLGSLALALFGYGLLLNLLNAVVPSLGVWAAPVAFLVTLIVARLLLERAVEYVLAGIDRHWHGHLLNRILGVVPGVINGFLWMLFLSALFMLMPLTSRLSGQSNESKLNDWVLDRASWAKDKLAPVFTDFFQKIVPANNAAVNKEESIDLPFKVNKPSTRPDLEAEMLELVNQERAKEGLKPFKADTALRVVARKHSADMFARGYFSHIAPEGTTPFQRIDREGILYLTAGENLALAPTLKIAHEGLMKSPGHRANILRPAFGRVGIGVLQGGIYGLMITQNFRN